MRKMLESNPIWHAMIWIFAYVLTVNIGDNISKGLGLGDSVTVALLVVFTIGLLLYLKKSNLFEIYGFKNINKTELTKCLFFIPLIATIPLHYFRGINQTLGYAGFILALIQMTCVGLIEEAVFRGFLYQGILKKSGVVRAVIISGATFGIGHVVNLARGYTLGHQIIQIVVGIFVGILLAEIVALTKNIIPCILWHALYNFSGTITNSDLVKETYMVLITSVICILYSVYLLKVYKFRFNYKDKLSV
jgi:uncharacterized protein